MWKMHRCTAINAIRVYVNMQGHSRGDLDSGSKIKVILTKDIKEFIEKSMRLGATPCAIWSEMCNDNSNEALCGIPSQEQIANYIKRVRKVQGANTVESIKEFLLGCGYSKTLQDHA
jgi:hypothetical protein